MQKENKFLASLQCEVIALKVEIAFFGIYGYTAIIPYMLVRTRSNIKRDVLPQLGFPPKLH